MIAVLAGDDQAQSRLGQGSEGRFLLSGEPLHSQEEIVGDFDGRLHDTAALIGRYGSP
jgi:hypothetical protein